MDTEDLESLEVTTPSLIFAAMAGVALLVLALVGIVAAGAWAWSEVEIFVRQVVDGLKFR